MFDIFENISHTLHICLYLFVSALLLSFSCQNQVPLINNIYTDSRTV